jgi:Ca-activated chloride channel family protein
MKFDPEDPRLSAYAFGELDTAERTEVEALLARDADARRFVDELRATASELERELAAEPKLELSVQQRATIAAEAIGSRPILSLGRARLRWYGGLAAAAGIAAAALVGYRLMRDEPGSMPFTHSLDGQESWLAGGTPAPAESPAVPNNLLAKNEPSNRAAARLAAKASISAAPIRQGELENVRQNLGDAVSSLDSLEEKLGAVQSGSTPSAGLIYDDGQKKDLSELSNDEIARLRSLGYAGGNDSELSTAIGVSVQARGSKGTNHGPGNSVPPGSGGNGASLSSRGATMPVAPATGGVPTGDSAGGTLTTDMLYAANAPAGSAGELAAGRPLRPGFNSLTTGADDFFARRFDLDAKQAGETYSKRKEGGEFNTESYDSIAENPFKLAKDDPLSTFSIDVDTASYSNVRRMLVQENRLPSPGAVRIEEMLNYFRYAYPAPDGPEPFSVTTEVGSAPWSPNHRLVRIGLRGRDIPVADRKQNNLVFLLDVSGSMDEPSKLPLVQRSLRLLVEQLDERDRVAIVVYAGSEGLALPSTSCMSKATILNAVDLLKAGGSTNGGAGIKLAYKVARENLLKDGTNRVVLCTDGDFNVGVSSDDELVRLVEEERKSGVFLSVLGFGSGNLKDSKMEKLADKGNGNYAYVDTLAEARKVLVAEMGGTLIPIAKDVKLQLEFNPSYVQAWRLVGYENRVLAHQDFKDDTKDAGELGAGTCVTALYEIVPTGVPFEAPSVDPLRYQQPLVPTITGASGELLYLKLRYKQPNSDTSTELSYTAVDKHLSVQETSVDFKFAASVAGFGMLLRKSQFLGAGFDIGNVQRLALEGLGDDKEGYRSEFATLVAKARMLWPQPDKTTSGVK